MHFVNRLKTNFLFCLETNVWTKDEIKSFEDLILKNDKNFTEISKSVSAAYSSFFKPITSLFLIEAPNKKF